MNFDTDFALQGNGLIPQNGAPSTAAGWKWIRR